MATPVRVPGATTSRELGLAVGALLTVTLLAYRRSFAVPFQLDDLPVIVDNPAVQLQRLDWASLARAASGTRPLSTLSLALNAWVTGPEPFGFHVVNLAIHVTCAVLVYLVARRVLDLAMPPEHGRTSHVPALVTALLFAVHPVHTQAVTYVVQRMASQGALFALLATLLWLSDRASKRSWLARGAAVAAWLAAVASKENYVILPAVLLGTDLVLGRTSLRRAAQVAVPAVAAIGALTAMLVLFRRAVLEAEYARLGFGPLELLVEQPRVLLHYLSILAWPLPSRLRLDLTWDISRTLLEPRALAATLAVAVLLVGAVLARHKTLAGNRG